MGGGQKGGGVSWSWKTHHATVDISWNTEKKNLNFMALQEVYQFWNAIFIAKLFHMRIYGKK